MKFQKHLEWRRVPDWRDAYFNYKQLKKDLKKVKQNVESQFKLDFDVAEELGSSISLLSEPPRECSNEEAFVVVRQKSLRTYTEEQVFYETELLGPWSEAENVQNFFMKLDSQLNMINHFYKHKENEYMSHACELQNQLQILVRKQNDVEAGFLEKNAVRAKKLLRTGFMEFYRSLNLLKEYIFLNRMAFGKILKKYDKLTGKNVSGSYLRAVHLSYFSTSDKINRMMEQVKCIFTEYFSKGNRTKAVACLQPIRQQPYNINFFLGLFTGFSCSLLITFGLVLSLPHIQHFPRVQTAFPLFSTLVLCVLHMYMYACNIFCWRKARVSYSYLFGFEPGTELQYKDVLLLSILLTMGLIFGLVAYLGVHGISSTSTAIREAVPLGVFMVLFGLLLFPFNTFYKPARYAFLNALLRISFAPLFKVVLPDFFLADQLTSQVTSFKNIGYILCYYSGGFFKTGEADICSSKISFQYPLVVLPYWWRLMQCLRRYVDMRDSVQLANAAKYLTSLVAIVLKITYNRWTNSSAWTCLFVISSITSMLYQLYWDFVKDCGFFELKTSNFLLRDNLMLEKKSPYYMFMILNVLLRTMWLLSLFHLQLGASKSMGAEFILAMLEIFRRGIWNFFRLENEHLNNVGKFRAIRDIPLPFEDEPYTEVTPIRSKHC